MSKVIFLDVDGTVCNYEGVVPNSAVEAVRAARARGHLVYLCTGRSRAEVYPELWDIGVNGLIGGNGSYVEHRGQIVQHLLIPEQDARAVVDWLKGRGLEFFLESNNGLFASENFETAAVETIRTYAAGKGAENAATMTVKDAFPEMIFGGELYRDDLNKISFLLGDYRDYVDAAAHFPQLKAGTWGGKGEYALFGDLGVAGITKATAMQVLLEHLGRDRADTIAFGDAKVDIPMFDFAALGVAMGNSGPETLEAADMVTDEVDSDGLAKAFEKLGLI